MERKSSCCNSGGSFGCTPKEEPVATAKKEEDVKPEAAGIEAAAEGGVACGGDPVENVKFEEKDVVPVKKEEPVMVKVNDGDKGGSDGVN
ncbi:hypothetical protein U1Q18_004298 [Sarracenia purpurea var. burkii]